MKTLDPKLQCPPALKAEFEARNGVSQLDYITHLVNDRHVQEVRESHVRELHALAIEGIYPCGGKYRNATVQVEIQDSAHRLPHESRVPSLVVDLLANVNSCRFQTPVLERAAHVLWRINWIHPFAGGNGRTARALAYLIVCIDNGGALPGIPTMPALIAKKRDEYVRCLQSADAATLQGKNDHVALAEMTAFMREVLTQQLESAINFDKLGLKVS